SVALLQGEVVPVRVEEPGDARPARRDPDGVLVLLEPAVALELDALGAQLADRRGDVGDAPAEHGVRRRHDLAPADHAEWGPVRVEQPGEVARLDEPEPEHAAVEPLGLLEVGAADEPDERRVPEHTADLNA